MNRTDKPTDSVSLFIIKTSVFLYALAVGRVDVVERVF